MTRSASSGRAKAAIALILAAVASGTAAAFAVLKGDPVILIGPAAFWVLALVAYILWLSRRR